MTEKLKETNELTDTAKQAGSECSDLLCVTVCGGKYTFKQTANGATEALRHGEPWRDCTGDGLILALAQEVEHLRETIQAAKNCLVCSCIADPFEVCENTLTILDT